MPIVLYHHPFSRAAAVVWMLEEIGADYELRYVDMMNGAHKAPELLKLNPMGKLPLLIDGDTVVTESAAIGLYLADRYAYGRLAPKVDDAARAPYLRWSLYAPSVIEPGVSAKLGGWGFHEAQVGWGAFEAMLKTMEHAIGEGPFLLGQQFSMADVIFGGTVRYLMRTGGLDPRPCFQAYSDRLSARPALQRADARNAAIRAELGL